MSSKPQQGQGIQLHQTGPRQSNMAAEGERPRTSTAIAREFQYLKQKMENNVVVEKARRTSRMSRGLNPDVPRPAEPHKYPPKDAKEAEGRKMDQKAGEIQKMDQHKISLEELCFRYGLNLQSGLTNEAANRRNAEEGDNKLPEKEKTPAWIKFLKQITNWFAILLWVGAILCIITYIVEPSSNVPNLVLGIVLIIVILITGMITFMQSAKSDALMEGFKNMLPSVCKVLREGKVTQMPAQKLVRGDIVQVISGQKIPADLRIIKSIEMKVDNSPLTGEVEPLLRSPECTHPEEPFETKNLAFFGTLCKEGRGKGIVIQIGAKTVMGQIADLAATGGSQKSPLRIQLDRFVLIITVIALTLGVLFFLLALLVVHYPVLESLIFGIGILVANVPEGLLACITISLAITAKKLADKQVLVKNLQAVETLGSTSCICSDKTGTLTQNKMTVQNIWIDGQVLRAHSKEIKGPEFEYQYDINDPSFKILHHTAMICSEAKFDISEEKKREPGFKYANAPVIGDASQTALVKFYQPIEEITQTRNLYPLGKCKDGSESKMPFNSTNKYALSIVRQEGPDYHYVAYIKGAPQKIWKFCGRTLFQGKYKQIDAEEKKKFQAVNLRFGKNGERVLGFAMLPLNKEIYHQNYQFVTSSPDNFNFPTENFIFVGLISLMDPPKESVPYAIKKCQSAGIKVIMVTGDQPPTAAAIAKQIGIITMKTNQDLKEQGFSAQQALEKAKAIVIHGDMIVKAYEESEEEGDRILETWCKKKQIVFARTTPAQKLLIVKANQRLGAIVGVTGDGVNDSPAIKQGDIGISMGISGSDVTKDAADMILLNDDFASIVDGVQEGRKIFDNLKKTIVYLLTSNMTEIWPFVALVIVQVPLPLSNIFMLIICVGTDIYPALSLAYEIAEVDIMTRRPRKPDDHLVSGKLLAHAYGNMGELATCGGLFTYNLIMTVYGLPFQIYFEILSFPTYNPAAGNNGNTPYDGNYNQLIVYDIPNANVTNGYDPSLPFLGSTAYYSVQNNCNLAVQQSFIQAGSSFPNWLATNNNLVDVRYAYVGCCMDNTNNFCSYYNSTTPGSTPWPDPTKKDTNVLWTTSSISGTYVMFTTEALYYAQSGYFVTIVMIQWSNVFACKSRKMTIIYSAPNRHMFGGIILETCLFVLLLYVPGVNYVFGGRQLPFFLLGIPGLGFSLLLLCWEQGRKRLLNWDYNNDNQPNWFQKTLLW